jgi:presenilin-like A22 family membrane protease
VKHTWRITIILLAMFLATQLIGLAVVYSYSIIPELPYGMQPPVPQTSNDFWGSIGSIVIAFAIAVGLMLLLSRFKISTIFRVWFFVVVIIALGITLNSVLFYFPIKYVSLISTLIAIPLAYFKVFKQNILVHNITELLIYPGIAAVFIPLLFYAANPILSVIAIVIILIAISLYDIYAVWHAGFMQKMAKFQIEEVKIFAGFFIPYIGKKDKLKIKQVKQKYQKKSTIESKLRKEKIKVSLAILGGGDVMFPLITAGLFLRIYGIVPALLVVIGATIALALLFLSARKGKFYPAMPFLTAGIFVGMVIGWLASLII